MLFNKSNNGAQEIKALIGWIYKSNSYDNLVTYLKIARRDIIKVIGKEVYELARTHYISDNYESELQQQGEDYTYLDDLVHAIQLPMALLAYRKYAPGVDISHSEQGRQITVTEQLKPAFEWMIERDNRNISDLAHTAIDMLIEYLDAQTVPPVPEEGEEEDPVNDIGTTWAASTAYTQAKSLFINSAEEFDKVYPINQSRRLYIIMLPFIREVENRYILPYITKTRYEAIVEKIRDNDLEEEDNQILLLSRTPIALLSMSVALKRLTVETLPEGIVQNYSSFDPKQTRVADNSDRLGLSALLERDGKRELLALQSYIASLATPVEEEIEEVTDTTKPFFMS